MLRQRLDEPWLQHPPGVGEAQHRQDVPALLLKRRVATLLLPSLLLPGFEGLTGDQAPLGFWDPLGFSKDLDVEVFKRLGLLHFLKARLRACRADGKKRPFSF